MRRERFASRRFVRETQDRINARERTKYVDFGSSSVFGSRYACLAAVDPDTSSLVQKSEHSPIACLPAEILARIFSLLIPVAKVPLFRGSMPEASLGWAKVTHVCRRWRDVALGFGELWANIVLHPGTVWAEESLSRAGPYPLTIELRQLDTIQTRKSGRSTLTDSSITFIRTHASRIRVLRIFDLGTVFFQDLKQKYTPCEAFAPVLANPPPALESLLLDMSLVQDYFSPAQFTTFWPPIYPCLRRLVLTGLWREPPWRKFPISPELRHLTIALVPGTPIRSSLGDIFYVLHQLASLQSLQLAHCLPDCHYWAETSLEHATLPKLESLSLHGPVMACTRMFLRMDISPSASIDIRCVLPPWPADTNYPTRTQKAFLEACCCPASLERFTRAQTAQFIMMGDSAEVLIGEGTPTIPMLSTDFTTTHEYATKLVLEGKGWEQYRLLETVVGALLPWAALTALSIVTARELNGKMNMMPPVWPRFLAMCDNLTQLRLLGTDITVRVCEALAGNLERGWAAHAPVMLPRLDTLALGSVNLKRWWHMRTHVRVFMLQRVERGAPLRMLRVASCRGGEEWVGLGAGTGTVVEITG
ncbi:hypothetical protein FA95DRAFT_1683620 [Auriscalpium vulgare]|uniref:Uncharacterized protein n=1 Tax=Auriscalpium vulgare TaxID=40419 RepID=A0ACB8R9C9_9AGAM|nr:hypothetical protein FA95DRAFT_1683620 [Auriscalpium vulgare]